MVSVTQSEANLLYPSAHLQSSGVVLSEKQEGKGQIASRQGSDGFVPNIFSAEHEVLHLHITDLLWSIALL